MPNVASTAPKLTPAQISALHALPRFYTYSDVLDRVFKGNEEAFVRAWTSGLLSQEIRKQIEESVERTRVHTWWLQRIAQQLDQLLETKP